MPIKTYEKVQSLAELLEVERDQEPPTESDLQDLRADLDRDLTDLASGWGDRPHGPLRITKARLQSTGVCHAQVLAEAQPFVLDSDVAMGAICDIAAGIVALHPTYRPESGWFHALEPALAPERPDVVSLIADFPHDQAELFFETLDQRCNSLPTLIGDVRQRQHTVRERARMLFGEAQVLLSIETDLVTRGEHPTITEVKSGRFGPWILDELRFYALVRSLRDMTAPSWLCAISLADDNFTAIPLRIEDLFAAARRVVAAAEVLMNIDRLVFARQPVPTTPGSQCRWCRRVRVCPDVSDTILSELPALTYPEAALDDEF